MNMLTVRHIASYSLPKRTGANESTDEMKATTTTTNGISKIRKKICRRKTANLLTLFCIVRHR